MGIAQRLLFTGLLAATLVVSTIPTAQAMTRWEYKTMELKSVNATTPQQLELLLNQLGQEGWNLIEIGANGVAIFKREK